MELEKESWISKLERWVCIHEKLVFGGILVLCALGAVSVAKYSTKIENVLDKGIQHYSEKVENIYNKAKELYQRLGK